MTEREALSILKGDDPEAVARAESALWQRSNSSSKPHLSQSGNDLRDLLQGAVPPQAKADSPQSHLGWDAHGFQNRGELDLARMTG